MTRRSITTTGHQLCTDDDGRLHVNATATSKSFRQVIFARLRNAVARGGGVAGSKNSTTLLLGCLCFSIRSPYAHLFSTFRKRVQHRFAVVIGFFLWWTAKPDWVLFACWLALNTVKYSSGPTYYHPPAEDDARTICDNIKQQEWWSTRRRTTLTRMYFWSRVELGSIRADDEDRQQNNCTDHHILGTAHFVWNCLCRCYYKKLCRKLTFFLWSLSLAFSSSFQLRIDHK